MEEKRKLVFRLTVVLIFIILSFSLLALGSDSMTGYALIDDVRRYIGGTSNKDTNNYDDIPEDLPSGPTNKLPGGNRGLTPTPLTRTASPIMLTNDSTEDETDSGDEETGGKGGKFTITKGPRKKTHSIDDVSGLKEPLALAMGKQNIYTIQGIKCFDVCAKTGASSNCYKGICINTARPTACFGAYRTDGTPTNCQDAKDTRTCICGAQSEVPKKS